MSGNALVRSRPDLAASAGSYRNRFVAVSSHNNDAVMANRLSTMRLAMLGSIGGRHSVGSTMTS